LPWAVGLLWLLAPLAAGAEQGSAGGIHWTVPGAKGSETGECAVFYFGKGQGGGVEENLARWAKQFEQPAFGKTTTRTVGGLRVHVTDIAGTYLESGGPMMEPREKKPNYRLLGAIVEAPEGLVFIKCTGPAATIGQAEQDFDRLIQSLGKGDTTTI